MPDKIRIASLPEFDASLYLDSEESIARYLEDVMEEGDPALMAAALEDIARARGMAEVALQTGVSRETLYRAMRTETAPDKGFIAGVCKTLVANARADHAEII